MAINSRSPPFLWAPFSGAHQPEKMMMSIVCVSGKSKFPIRSHQISILFNSWAKLNRESLINLCILPETLLVCSFTHPLSVTNRNLIYSHTFYSFRRDAIGERGGEKEEVISADNKRLEGEKKKKVTKIIFK